MKVYYGSSEAQKDDDITMMLLGIFSLVLFLVLGLIIGLSL